MVNSHKKGGDLVDKNMAIQNIALTLTAEADEFQRQLSIRRNMLDDLADICDHPTVEVYRNYQTGTCEFCRHEFRTRRSIDMIYVD